jgi:hypothetical protein
MSGARGEATIQAGDREVRLLFTNRAILAAEQQLGKGIVQTLNEFSSGGSYTTLVALLRSGMEAARQDARAGGKPVSNSDALDVLDAVGFAAAAGPVMEALAAAISYAGEEPADPNG